MTSGARVTPSSCNNTETSFTIASPKFFTATSISSGTFAARVPGVALSEAIARFGRTASTQFTKCNCTPLSSRRPITFRSSVGSSHSLTRKSETI